MKRTQIYITAEQERRIADIADDQGVSKAEVIRRMLDRGLGKEGSDDQARNAIRATAGLLADYPDWQEWQRHVRGRSANERLRSQGR